MGTGVGPNTVCYARQISVRRLAEKAEDFSSSLAHYFRAGVERTCRSKGQAIEGGLQLLTLSHG
jgi:hypothetical protein